MRLDQSLHVFDFNRMSPGKKTEQKHAERVEVGNGRGLPTFDEFRRKDEGSAAGERQIQPIEIPSGTEVDEDVPASFVLDDIARFDITVNQTGTVNGGQSGRDISSHPENGSRTHRPIFVKSRLQGSPLQRLHPDPGFVVDFRRAIDSDDVRMPHAGQPARFGQQSVRCAGAVHLRSFESDLPVESRIEGAIDSPERSLRNLSQKDEGSPRIPLWKRLVGADPLVEPRDPFDLLEPLQRGSQVRRGRAKVLPIQEGAVRQLGRDLFGPVPVPLGMLSHSNSPWKPPLGGPLQRPGLASFNFGYDQDKAPDSSTI